MKKISAPNAKKGFTLVEVLTSMAVLSVMLVIWASMFRMATSTWSEGRKKTDLNGKARLLFDMMSRDFSAGIFRSDTPSFVNESGEFDYAFYSQRESEDSESRKLSAVRYHVDTNAWFYRQSTAVDWSRGAEQMVFLTNVIPALTNSVFATLRDEQRVMSGVARMEMAFVSSKSDTFPEGDQHGYFANRYYTGCKSIVVTLALMDDTTVDVLGEKIREFTSVSSGKLPRMEESMAYSNNITYYNGSILPSEDGVDIFSKTHRVYWDSLMNSDFFEKYPRHLRTGLKVFERYYMITLPADGG